MTRLTSLFRSKRDTSQRGGDLHPGNSAETSGTLAVADPTNGLPYRVSDHKKHWAWWLSAFVFDGAVIPVVLFYALWYGSSCSSWTVLAVITSLSFWTAYHKWFSRGWRLFFRREATYRPLFSRRFTPDTSYIVLTLALGVMILELVIATATKDAKVRVVAMAPVSTLYIIAVYTLLQNSLHMAGVRAPFALSSCRRGETVWPALATVMEDVFCVDGCHEGSAAREKIRTLVENSAAYRRSILLLGWIWCVACLAVAIALSIVVARTAQTTSLGICFGISWPFIAVMTMLSVWWMERLDRKGTFAVGSAETKVMTRV